MHVRWFCVLFCGWELRFCSFEVRVSLLKIGCSSVDFKSL